MPQIQKIFGFQPDENGKWELPKELPDLSREEIIGLDTETRDPDLKKKGPGVRREGYLIGISVATVDGRAWYLPFGHEEGNQFPKEQVIRWAKDQLEREGLAKIGANLLYDLDYLYHEGVKVSGPFYDVQVAEPLLNENRKVYSLDSLAKRYLNSKKTEELLEDICRVQGWKGSPQEHLWKMDPAFVGKYAEDDARLVIPIFNKQVQLLKKEQLEKVFDMETRLIPALLHMRRVGVPIDVQKVELFHTEMKQQLGEEIQKLKHLSGVQVDYWAAESIAKAVDQIGLSYPRTEKKSQPSFTKQWLERHEHPIAQQIVRCRELDKLIGTFIEGSLLETQVHGRIHCLFHAMKSDDHGTVTGRLSSSNPNLQFIPTRTELGKRMRKMFIPDKDHEWIKQDYSQIELRILAHYAMGEGSAAIRSAYNQDPEMDLHQWCADEVGVSRREAKTVNFGIVYGMGAASLATNLGISIDEAKLFLRRYFGRLPFIQNTIKIASQVADSRGYVKTIMGRRRRFELWEPADPSLVGRYPPTPNGQKLSEEIDKDYHGKVRSGVKRVGTYKAFNAVDQGTAADIMKKALVDIWESGVCRVIQPYVTVHDEIDYGKPMTREGQEAVEEIKRIMEKTIPLHVPVLVDTEIGKNWGELCRMKQAYGKNYKKE